MNVSGAPAVEQISQPKFTCQSTSPRQVPAALQVLQGGEQIDGAGGGVSLPDERHVRPVAGLVQIPGRAAERRGGHHRPGRGLAVVIHPDHDLLVQAVEPDVVRRLGVGAADRVHGLGIRAGHAGEPAQRVTVPPVVVQLHARVRQHRGVPGPLSGGHLPVRLGVPADRLRPRVAGGVPLVVVQIEPAVRGGRLAERGRRAPGPRRRARAGLRRRRAGVVGTGLGLVVLGLEDRAGRRARRCTRRRAG